jgi:thiol-disulfide isomerase/thioredoxin
MIALTGLLLSGCLMPPGQPLSPDDLNNGPITFEQITPYNQNLPEGLSSKPKVPTKNSADQTENMSRETLTQLSDLSPEKRAEIMTPNAGLIPFDQEKYNNLKNSQEMALFFHADWCDACRLVENDLKRGNGLVPGGLILFRVDFDEQKDLVEDFQAKVGQVVILNEKGEIATRYAGTNFDSLIFQLRKVME